MAWYCATLLAFLAVVTATPPVLATQRSADIQIAEAVTPLKNGRRDAATVYGYSDGQLTVLRQGTSPDICIADNPRDERFQVSCYHASLEPFMARGRELRAEGIRGRQRQRTRNAEIDAGLIEMPKLAYLVSYYGMGDLDRRTGWPDSVTVLQVVYVPYATSEESGLSDRPSRSSAYLMGAGTGRAHIMIPGRPRKFRPKSP